MKKLSIGLALATVVGAMSVGVASPAFAAGTITALTVDKTSVASGEDFTISSTGTDWTGCVAKVDPGETTDQFPYDASYDISGALGQQSSWNGYGTASGLAGIFSIRLYSGSCATVTQGATTPAFEITVNVAPVNGAGEVDVTLYETYDSSTLEATPYSYPAMTGSFDGSTSGWSEVVYTPEARCGAGITGLPAGVTVDQTYSPGGGVAPLLKFSGTPAAGSKGTYTTCLDLNDGDSICEHSYWIATITVSDGVPPAPKLANTGADSQQMVVSGAVAASILLLGAVFVVAYRRRVAVTAKRSE
jgi:LPXTG-motif cell wall-anchored protein